MSEFFTSIVVVTHHTHTKKTTTEIGVGYQALIVHFGDNSTKIENFSYRNHSAVRLKFTDEILYSKASKFFETEKTYQDILEVIKFIDQ